MTKREEARARLVDALPPQIGTLLVEITTSVVAEMVRSFGIDRARRILTAVLDLAEARILEETAQKEPNQ